MGTSERTGQPAADRERREELEVLQVQLREAKASLERERSATGAPPEVEALREAVARAALRCVEAKDRRKALEAEREALTREAAWLTKELEEEQVLALGASRRDHPVEWATMRNRDGTPTSPAAAAALWILTGGFFLFIIFAKACEAR